MAKAYSTYEGRGALPIVIMGPVVDKLKRFQPVSWHWFGAYGLFRQEALYAWESASTIGAEHVRKEIMADDLISTGGGQGFRKNPNGTPALVGPTSTRSNTGLPVFSAITPPSLLAIMRTCNALVLGCYHRQ